MKILITLLVLMIQNSYSADFKVGDVIFTTYRPCRVCQVIEDETGSPYSHLGIIVKIDGDSVEVADSLSVIKTTEAKEFIEKSHHAVLYRLKPGQVDLSEQEFSEQLHMAYKSQFEGILYDKYFDWENTDEDGRELLYCSEFVVKILNIFLNNPIKTKPMNYTKNYDFWVKYFGKVPIPQDQPGMNPGALAKKPIFDKLEVLK